MLAKTAGSSVCTLTVYSPDPSPRPDQPDSLYTTTRGQRSQFPEVTHPEAQKPKIATGAMIHFTEAAQAALLNWINTFELPRKAESLDNLQDGLIFGEVLNALCADYGADGVTLNKNAASWPEKKHNLETVYRGLARLLRQDNPHLAPAAAQFRAIADNPNENGMCEFISAFVAATCLGSLSQNYIPKILKLNKNDQQEIAKVIMRKEEQRNEARKIEDEREEESRREEKYIDNDAFEAARDQDLAREEALLKLKKEVEKLRKQNADLHSRHDSLLEKHALLNAALRKAETELEAQRMTGSTTVPKFIQQLEEEKRENTALIDTLQAQVNDYEQEIVKLRRENTSLQAKADRVKDLDDKVKILEYEKKENEKMERVLENYKKKAQESTTYQHQIRELQAKNDELQAATSEYESLRLTKQTLEDTIEAFREKVADYEQSLHEQSVFRTSLQDTINDLRAQLESLQSRHNIDEAHIKDLEEKLQMGGGSFTQRSSSPDQSASFNLEQELETTADPTTALRLEVSRLKTENNVLRNMTVQTEAQRLREDLELVTRKADHLSTQNSDLVEKHALAQEQISALVSKVPAERLVSQVHKLMRESSKAGAILDYSHQVIVGRRRPCNSALTCKRPTPSSRRPGRRYRNSRPR